jgi:signal transduction histidine kinase
MSVKSKLLALVGCILAGFLLVCGINLFGMRQVDGVLGLERLAVRVQTEVLQMRRQEKNALLRRDPEYLVAVRAHQQAALAALQDIRRLDVKYDPLCETAQELLGRYLPGFETMLADSDPHDPKSPVGIFLARSADLEQLAAESPALAGELATVRRLEARWSVLRTPLSLETLEGAVERLAAEATRSVSPQAARTVEAFGSALDAYADQMDEAGSRNAAFAEVARSLEPVIGTLRRNYETRRRDISRVSTLAEGVAQAALLLLVVLVSLAIFRGIAAPLAKLRRHAGRVARGESTDLDPATFAGEFRDLAWDIRRMENHLLSTIMDLARKESEAAEEARMAREARRRAEDMARVKSNFLNLVSHELKTPLTSMVGFSQVMLRRLERGLFAELAENRPELSQEFSRFHDNLDIMLSEGRRLATLIDNVLELAALESGHAPLVMDAVPLDELVNLSVEPFLPAIAAKGLEFVREIPADLPPLRCDRDRIVYVLRHLFSNAVKFTDAGSIACRARREGDLAVISVEDTGRGIPPEKREAVFEKFLQLGDHDTDKVPGLGIGLAASRAVVEYHGGTIHISGAPGQGSTVTLTMPLADMG